MRMIIAVVVFAVLCAGCANSQVKRVYSVNASGYATVENGDTEEAKRMAVYAAKENVVESVSRFLEHRLAVSSETSQVISHNAKVERSWVEGSSAGAKVTYDFDLYEFVGKNYDMKDYAAWELLGLANHFSDYARSGTPIGIWLQKRMSDEKNRNPYVYASLSILPVFSGNFMLQKNVMGGFFTAVKLASLATMIFNEKTGAKITGGVLLAVATGADFYSVYAETSNSIEKLESLQDAVLSGSGISFEILTLNFK